MLVRTVVRAAGLGYAMPGTVLALGLLIPLAALDNHVDALLRATFGVSSGLLLSGSLFVIVLAYTIRFLAVSLGALEAGFERLSPNLDAAARTLGETALSALWRVHMPLLLPALGAAALLVFVDGMKELPATLLLRPFNFETLATHVYSYAGARAVRAGGARRTHHRPHRPRAGAAAASGRGRRPGRITLRPACGPLWAIDLRSVLPRRTRLHIALHKDRTIYIWTSYLCGHRTAYLTGLHDQENQEAEDRRHPREQRLPLADR